MPKKLPSHVTKLDNGKYRVRYKKTSKYPYEFDKTFDTIEEAINTCNNNEQKLIKKFLNYNASFTKFLKSYEFTSFCKLIATFINLCCVLDWWC